jgi:hypothetical protein
MEISEVRKLVEERLILSMKPTLSDEDKIRLRWLNDNIVIPVPERSSYKGFNITYYPLSDIWYASQGSFQTHRYSKEELFALIDGMPY